MGMNVSVTGPTVRQIDSTRSASPVSRPRASSSKHSSHHAVTGTSQLTINTQDTSGNPITGYYAVLNQSSNVQATGFTPANFNLEDGVAYTVQVDNYGNCHFDHWVDTGSASSSRTVSISGASTYTAVTPPGLSRLRCSSSANRDDGPLSRS